MAADTHAAATQQPNAVKIYLILLVLFAISVLGPTLGVREITLITAFGIAIVKATMVAAYFMQLNIEKRYIWWLMFVMLAFMLVLFAGVAPDVLKAGGKNWYHIEAKVPAPPAGHH